MKKKLIAFITVGTMLFSASVVSAYKYEPPYPEQDWGRVEQNMPEILSVETVPSELIASADFNSGKFSSETLAFNYNTAGATLTEDGTVKIEKNAAGSAYAFALKYTPTESLVAGDTYAFVCRIKGTNVKTTAPRNILEAYNTNHKHLAGTTSIDGKGDMLGNNDWYIMTQYLVIPQNTNYLNLQVNLAPKTTGTVYCDDFKLYRVALDPLENVVRTPNYKGLIFGDGYCNIDLDVLINPARDFYELDEMNLTVQLVDENDNVIYKSECEALSKKMNFVFSPDGLDEGDYYVQTILTDSSSGEVLAQKENTIRKRSKDYRPENYVDENGHFVEDGDKVFIKKMLNHGSYLDAAQFIKAAGINSIGNYGLWWAVEGNQYAEALDYMRENGMTSHICLSPFWFSDRSNNEARKMISEQSDTIPMLNQLAADYKNDPILDGYYLFDEPHPKLVGEEIRWNNEILAEADIDHPTTGIADKEYGTYGIYVKMTDILGIDPYPIHGNTDENGVPTDDFARTGRAVRQVKENFPERPVYYVMQGFHYTSRGDKRSPNYQELRNMAWQAICEGAEGLDWYAYPEMTADTTKTEEQWQEEVSQIISEVNTYENVILSDEPAPKHSVTDGGAWLNYCVRRYDGKTYLFAVNNTVNEHTATVTIDGIGGVELNFDPLEVKLLAFNQASYLSPEAELINMGLSNGQNVFMTYEGDVTKVYVPADSGVINYTAKISDDASLYIGNVEIPSKGKITVKNIDEFTLKVIAEDGKTIFCQSYQVVKEQEGQKGEEK